MLPTVPYNAKNPPPDYFRNKKWFKYTVIGLWVIFTLLPFFGAEFYRVRYSPEIPLGQFIPIRAFAGAIGGVIGMFLIPFLVGDIYMIVNYLRTRTDESLKICMNGSVNLFFVLVAICVAYFSIKVIGSYYRFNGGQFIAAEYFGCLFAGAVGGFGGFYSFYYFLKKFPAFRRYFNVPNM